MNNKVKILLVLVILVGCLLPALRDVWGQNEHLPVTHADARRLEQELRRIWYWLQHWMDVGTLPGEATENRHVLYVHGDTTEICFWVNDAWRCLPLSESWFDFDLIDAGLDTFYAGDYVRGDTLVNQDTIHVDLPDSLFVDGPTYEGEYDTTFWDMESRIVYIAPNEYPDSAGMANSVMETAFDSIATMATDSLSWTIVLLNGVHRPRDATGIFEFPNYSTMVAQTPGRVTVKYDNLLDDSWDDADGGLWNQEDYLYLPSHCEIRDVIFEFRGGGWGVGRNKSLFVANSNTQDITIKDCNFMLYDGYYRCFELQGCDKNLYVGGNYIWTEHKDLYGDCVAFKNTPTANNNYNINIVNNVIDGFDYAIRMADGMGVNTPDRLSDYCFANNNFIDCDTEIYIGVSESNDHADTTIYLKTYDNVTNGNILLGLEDANPLYIWVTNDDKLTWKKNRRVKIVGRDFYDREVVNTEGDTVWIGEQTDKWMVTSPWIMDSTIRKIDISPRLIDWIEGDSVENEYYSQPYVRLKFDSTAKDGWIDDISGVVFTPSNASNIWEHAQDSIAVEGSCAYFNGLNLYAVDSDTLDTRPGFYWSVFFKINTLGNSDVILTKSSPPTTNQDEDEFCLTLGTDCDIHLTYSYDGENNYEWEYNADLGITVQEDTTYFCSMWYDYNNDSLYMSPNPNDTVCAIGVIPINDTNNPLRLGGRVYSGNTYDTFDGWIDEFVFMSGHWPDAEDNFQMVKDIYAAGTTHTDWDTTEVKLITYDQLSQAVKDSITAGGGASSDSVAKAGWAAEADSAGAVDASTATNGQVLMADGNGSSSWQYDCPTLQWLTVTLSDSDSTSATDATNWNIDKSLIKVIRVFTESADWDMWLLQNDNGLTADDADIPALQLMEQGYGNQNISLDLPYEDEDSTQSIHLYYVDVDSTLPCTTYVQGIRAR